MFTLVPPSGQESTEWRAALETPPAAAVEAREALLARAAQLADTVNALPQPPSTWPIDVVISGCGFLVNYYLGVESILSRCGAVQIHRYAGASSGAKAPVHLLLAGEATTLDHHLAYGAFCTQRGGSKLHAACRNDRCARVTFDYLLEHHERELPRLDDKVHICVAQHTWRGPRRVVLSRYCDDSLHVIRQRMREFFHATGTLLTRVEGYGWCSDGAMAGNAPLFEGPDCQRDQLLCQPQRSGLPSSMVFAYSLEEAVLAVRKGQDDAVALLQREFSGAQQEPRHAAAGAGALSVVRRPV